jgi:hypothetical protein
MKTKKLIAALILGISASAFAAPYSSPIEEVLVTGRALAPLAINAQTKVGIETLQAQTKSAAPITMELTRIVLFKEQPLCGRIKNTLYQESTKTHFKVSNSALNICIDSTPPLRICEDEPLKLVRFDAACKDGKPPVDTIEVAKAIKDSLASGDLSSGQIKQKLSKVGAISAK